MSLSFSFEELIRSDFQRHLKKEFVLDQDIKMEAVLIRLLTGTVRIKNRITNIDIDQAKNYSILGINTNNIISSKPIRECVQPESTIYKLCMYLQRNAFTNHSFYENLLNEFCAYFFKSEKGDHTSAFLHAYRILEYISYSFPLIYASISRDYYGTFNRLSNYFTNTNSELKFFGRFFEALLDQALLDAPITFSFNSFNSSLNHNHYQVIKRYLPEDSCTFVEDISIETSYKHLIGLCIDLRNRYFHFAIGGRRNITNSDIIESDLFFELINEDLINWISIIYFEILKNSCES